MAGALIAIDWGTTNRRIFVLDAAGHVLVTARDGVGLLGVANGDFAGEVAAIRARHGDLPVILAGMVGSAKGWVEVPYLTCPASIEDLARSLCWVEPGRTAIVPGLSDPAGDVMRGEEVQVLGAAAAGLVPPDALLCQPGTHCKWVRVAAGRITGFATTMTGELFALLKAHSLLADFLGGEVADGTPFRDGVCDGLSGRLTSLLFRVRAAALLGQRPVAQSAAYASGLLIGHDVGGEAFDRGQIVHLLADPQLGALYASAIRLAGGNPVLIDSHAAFVAGINLVWKASRP
jgi:2-dehydro-3-deoxygalactonokinase